MDGVGSIVKGTIVLSGAAFLNKLLGAVYRIGLARLIGAEGMGLYQMAYPVYLIFLSLSTAGLPLAISKMVAERARLGDMSGVRSTLQASGFVLTVLGTVGSVVMIVAAPWVATRILADARSMYPMRAMAPGILLMSLTAILRGYFQGWGDMRPSALSQIVEQSARVGTSLVLAYLLMSKGLEHAAAGAAFGATVGGAASLGYLLLTFYGRQKSGTKAVLGNLKTPFFPVVKRLVRLALPIAAAVALTPLLQALDAIVVPRRLQAIGYSVREATTMLGVLGNSWSVIYLPLIITTAISTNLVPAIASGRAGRKETELRERSKEGLRMAWMYLIPVFVVLFVCGKGIYQFLYGSRQIILLCWLAPAILFLGMEQVSAGIMQGLGKPEWPLIHYIFGALVKVGITYTLTGFPGLNLAGAALGTIAGSILTSALNLRVLKKMRMFRVKCLWPAFGAGMGMFWLCKLVQEHSRLPVTLEWISIGGFGCAGYLILLWILGGISPRDLEVFQRFYKKKENDHD